MPLILMQTVTPCLLSPHNTSVCAAFLPSYCKRGVIQKALEENDAIFDLAFDDQNVTFTIHEKYAQKNMREKNA